MNLLKEYVRKERETLVENGIRFQVLGRWRDLDPSVVREIETTLEATACCTGMSFNIALNYSGRCEIVDACRRIVADWAAGKRADIDEETIGRYLYTSGQPDPDLLIRTSGELRVSNFLLWQIAYAEIWVTQTLWPDFRRRDLFEAILAYQGRERRYGGVVQPQEPDFFASGIAGAAGKTPR
jgi:undecaprenyl diphosphate synthase